VKGIADTGFLVAFANRNDRYHEWALGIAEQVVEPLLTCEAVLAEAAFHLGSASVVLAMLEEGLIALSFDCRAHLAHLTVLARRYADRQPDLADLCLIRMSELYPRHGVLTVDRADFRIYRRNKRDAIPLICPPDARGIRRARPPFPDPGSPHRALEPALVHRQPQARPIRDRHAAVAEFPRIGEQLVEIRPRSRVLVGPRGEGDCRAQVQARGIAH
jgi:predicted nucleic acid-binding protein